MPGRQTVNVAEGRARRKRTPITENLLQGDGIKTRAHSRMRENGFDFRTKDQAAARAGIEHRTDAEAIPGQKEGAVAFVVNSDRKLAVETCKAFRPELLVKVEDDLGIGMRCELVPACFEFGAQLDIVENLAIEDDPECAVLIADWLLAARKVHDA